MSRILVTGGAGYIGTSLVPRLLDAGHGVTVFDSLLHGGDALMPFFACPAFRFVRGDVRDADALQEASAGADLIVHLAAVVGFPACEADPAAAEAVNHYGSVNVADAAAGRPILYASTVSVYGRQPGRTCDEAVEPAPLSAYGRTKLAAERVLLDAGAVAFRLATVFGVSGRMRLDLLINDLVFQAARNGYAVVYEPDAGRPFVHVRDVARFLSAPPDESMRGQAYNAGDEGLNTTKRRLCEVIARETGATFHFAEVGADKDQRDYEVDFGKIRRAGYRTSVSIEEGIRELVRAEKAVQVRNPYSNVRP